ncbi:hypothetical protein CLV70_14319, partial [Pseudosporangium ferrugineum]
PQPLRDVVEVALAKDPADRPTARELLDMLLGHQPVMRPAVAPPVPAPAPAPAPAPVRERPTVTTGSRDELLVAAPGSRHAAPEPLSVRDGRVRGHKLLAALAVLLVLAGLTTVGLVVRANAEPRESVLTGPSPDGGAAAGAPAPAPGKGGTGSAQPDRKPAKPGSSSKAAAPKAPPAERETPVPLEPSGGEPIIQDPLDQPGQWLDSEIREQQARCFTSGVMRAERVDRGTYQCVGPDEDIEDDFGVEVTTALQTAGSCAAVWFHWSEADGGQVLRVCQDEVVVGADMPADRTVYGRVAFKERIALKKSTRVHLVVRDGAAQIFRGGRFAGEVELPSDGPDTGQVRLGLSVEAVDTDPPYAVTFANVDIRSL